MPGRDIIVIGASAGAVEALAELARGLPSDLPAAVFVVIHFPTDGTSVLPNILERAGRLPAVHASDGEKVRPGRIYVAPPNYHMLLRSGAIHLVRGPRENGHRPAIDPLFRSAALAYGRRVIGVILSGNLDDGTAGLLAIKKRGGIAVVQDPDDALYSSMPRSAIENVAVDEIAPLSEIAPLLARLCHEPLEKKSAGSVSGEMEQETELAELDMEAVESDRHPGTPSGFACPECNGALWELSERELIRFRCRVGHAYSADTLLVHQSDGLEVALWSALRALEERAGLSRRLADRSRRRGHHLTAERFERQGRESDQRATTIRDLLLNAEMLDPVTSLNEPASPDSRGHAGGHSPPHG